MPNKTIYVSDKDLPLYERAQELAGGNLSKAISTALRKYVETAEGRLEGYQEITVKVGVGPGRKRRRQRFTGVKLGEGGRVNERAASSSSRSTAPRAASTWSTSSAAPTGM
ncbi:hypothetical protein GCM10029992_01520 [Glycomyces albus]